MFWNRKYEKVDLLEFCKMDRPGASFYWQQGKFKKLP